MSNPVNDYDLQHNLPVVKRKIILLQYVKEIADKRMTEHGSHVLRIINNALENGYTLDEIDKKAGKMILIKGEKELLEKELEKLGL